MLAFRKGESDPCLFNGKFLHVACEMRDEERQEPRDLIGVDLGVKRLATTPEGVYKTGDAIERKRLWYLNGSNNPEICKHLQLRPLLLDVAFLKPFPY